MARKGNSDGFIHTVYAEGIWWQQQQLSMCVLPEGLFIPCLRLLIFEISIPIDTVPSPITHSYIHWSDLWSLAWAIVTGRGVYSPPRSAQSKFPSRSSEIKRAVKSERKPAAVIRIHGGDEEWWTARVTEKRERERKRQAIKTRQQNEKKKSTAFFGVPQFSIQQSQGMQLCVYVS